MTSFLTLYRVECRRALARRAVRGLIGVALLGCAIAGVVAFANIDQAEVNGFEPTPARLTDLWIDGNRSESVLVPTFLFLGVGALIGGATVFGAEWRAGTVSTVVTWVPRRASLLLARFAAAASLAAVISVALQATLVLAFLPTMLVKGSTSGVDGAWLVDLGTVVLRSMAFCGLAAAIGGAVANIGRNTTATLAAAFVWMAIVEAIVRGVWPARARWLLGENIVTFLEWERLDTTTAFERGPGTSALTLAVYGAGLIGLAVTLFHRRDLASTA
jgi:ABC-type transport system involved in multi-copper enzyme maturation permease subunit